MNKQEYEIIQAELTKLMDAEKVRNKNVATKYRDTYVDAVKACKSVLSNHNPTRKMSEKTSCEWCDRKTIPLFYVECVRATIDDESQLISAIFCPNCGRRLE